MKVYNLTRSGLGEVWASLHYLLHQSARISEPVGLNAGNVRPLAEECLALIKGPPEAEVVLTDEVGAENLQFPETYITPYYSTTRPWVNPELRPGNFIAYQFEAVSRKDEREIPDPALEKLLLNYFVKLGYQPIKLGLPMPLNQGVAMLSVAEAFVGVESGYAHVAHSVGIPTFLLANQMELAEAVTPHIGKPFTLCREVADVIRHFGIYHKLKQAVTATKGECGGCRRSKKRSEAPVASTGPLVLRKA